MTKVWLRWLPAAVIPAVIAAGALSGAVGAGAAVDLPEKTPEQVLAMVGKSEVRALSGTLEQTSQLGLPELPSTGPSANEAASSALELLTGSHTARVYLDGHANVRVQVLDRLAERNLARNGDEVWLYNSETDAATHLMLPDGTRAADTMPLDHAQTPAQLAERFLAAIDPSTAVTVDRDTEVAGRTAYELVLRPRTSDTLIGSVAIAVDSATGLPLSVSVLARDQSAPAFQLAFTQLTLEVPDAGLFEFVPPPGATVEEHALPQHDGDWAHPDAPGAVREQFPKPAVTGTGWDAVIEVQSGAASAELAASPLLDQLTRPVTGGRLLSTALVNVLLTDDGRVLVGSVPLERLQAVAAAGGE